MQEDTVKKINIKTDFSDTVFKKMRSERFGITFCCPLDLDKHSIKNELCDWAEAELPVYTTKVYEEEDWIHGVDPLPTWGSTDCGVGPADVAHPAGECLEDITCILFEVVNQNGDPVENYPIIVDGGNYGFTDEYGYQWMSISDASVNTEHTVDLCHCTETTGNCSQKKITITLTEECPKEVCPTPTTVCSSAE